MDGFLHWLRLFAIAVPCVLVAWLVLWVVFSYPSRRKYWGDLYRRNAWWFQRLKRDEPPIKLWTGKRRNGKTLRVTMECQKLMRRTVIREAGVKLDDHGNVSAEWPDGSPSHVFASNYPIHDLLCGRSAWVFETLEQLVEFILAAVRLDQTIIICLDEAQNVFDARDWEKTPAYFRTFLSESGHYKVGFLAATQALSMVEKRFRLLCDEIVRVEPVFESMKHKIALFSMAKIEDNVDSAEEEERVIGIRWFTWVTGAAFAGYSTAGLPSNEAISRIKDKKAEARMEALLDESRAFVSVGSDMAPVVQEPST